MRKQTVVMCGAKDIILLIILFIRLCHADIDTESNRNKPCKQRYGDATTSKPQTCVMMNVRCSPTKPNIDMQRWCVRDNICYVKSKRKVTNAKDIFSTYICKMMVCKRINRQIRTQQVKRYITVTRKECKGVCQRRVCPNDEVNVKGQRNVNRN